MLWSLFINWKLQSLRIFALLIHLIMQGVLIWTKFDSIQVAMEDPYDDAAYVFYNRAYMTLLGFGITFIMWQLACFLMSNPSVVTFNSVLHLVMDVLGVFFSVWITLDGLSWTNYIMVWLFCLLFPALFDLGDLLLRYSSRLWIRRNAVGYFQRLYMWWYGKQELNE